MLDVKLLLQYQRRMDFMETIGRCFAARNDMVVYIGMGKGEEVSIRRTMARRRCREVQGVQGPVE